MNMKGMILSIVWSLIIIIGITINYFAAKRITTGEFYICLMVWLYVSSWFIDKNAKYK